MKIKNKTGLRAVLRHENYDRIAIWGNGTWIDVGMGYNGETEGNNPILYIKRSLWYNLTHREISALIIEKEKELNRY